jgi:hypothetical protein
VTIGLRVVGDMLWERIGNSMDRVEQRLRKVVEILERSGVPYAIVGGNAVRVWVAQVDPGAVRATNDVDVLLRQQDLESVKAIMLSHGFHYRRTADLDMFVENESDSARQAVHIVLANQRVRLSDYEGNPDVEPNAVGEGIRTLPLESLVRMKLNSFRLKDRVHLLDMIQVGLIDRTWVAKFPAILGARLAELLENPEQ